MADRTERPKRPEPLHVPREALEWLQRTWQNPVCPICGTREWDANPDVFQLSAYFSGAAVLGSGPLYPVWPIHCRNCGYTVLFNALKAGIIKAPSTEAKEEGEAREEEPS